MQSLYTMGGDDGLRTDGTMSPIEQVRGAPNKDASGALNIMHLLTTVPYTLSGCLRDSLQVPVVLVGWAE